MLILPHPLCVSVLKVAGHHTAKLDPLGINSADLDAETPEALQLAKYSFGKYSEQWEVLTLPSSLYQENPVLFRALVLIYLLRMGNKKI